MLVRYEFCTWSRRSSRFPTHVDVFPSVAHRGLDGAVILVQPLSFALGDGYDGDQDNDGDTDNDGDKDDDECSGGDDDDDYHVSNGGGGGRGGGGDAEVDATPAATIIICTKVELKPSAQF